MCTDSEERSSGVVTSVCSVFYGLKERYSEEFSGHTHDNVYGWWHSRDEFAGSMSTSVSRLDRTRLVLLLLLSASTISLHAVQQISGLEEHRERRFTSSIVLYKLVC